MIKTSLLLTLSVVGFSLTGCARHRIEQRNTETTYKPDGSVVVAERFTDLRTSSFADSQNNITKVKTTNTDKTQSIGQDGFNNSASGTNALQALKELNQFIGNFK